MQHPDDTIVALASPPGPGKRGIVRLSGPGVRDAVVRVFTPVPPINQRGCFVGHLRLPGLHSPLPAMLLFAAAPRTYTGQDTAEFHLISSSPLLDALMAELLSTGARSAGPGEFTQRAFLNGKKDLTQAEAVLAVIDAATPDELVQSLTQLAGGLTTPLQAQRNDLLNLLADIEAGLDFADEDIQFVNKPEMLGRIGAGLAHLLNLRRQLESRAVSDRPFRVVLIGEPNAGKSSLFNVLAGKPLALVSDRPGTTRDYLSRSVVLDEMSVELVDTAGRQAAANDIESQAQALARAQSSSADLLLWCTTDNADSPTVAALRVRTKADLGVPPGEALAVSALTGQGINALKQALAERVRAARRPALAPSLSRCRGHVEQALTHLRAAHQIVLFDEPAELLALELRLALEQIGEMAGAVYTNDLLDRIFSRFCIGK